MIARFSILLIALTAQSVFAQTAPTPADQARIKLTAESICAACHGADGNSILAVNPSLAGQHPGYLFKQLHDFKSWDGKPAVRDNAVMAGMTAALSEADMRGLAAYFSSQTLKPETAKHRETLALGQKIWRAGDTSKGLASCAGCHGPAGKGIPPLYPSIHGQHAEYIEAQLKAFRVGERKNDPAHAMRDVASRLTDAEIKAVADYTAGLR
ncbi:MAG: cytochrome c4 [Candidatus Dactylopiibacterium carminicum]|uniref:Cytochrome c4 n=2 Tax=Candidatus Dactylopiibacterium carminicum TaxID=857335 RepID=A0A272ETI4_9RHOO|nr:cytochrome c4 [Candidatus Dactylopiibacterium carminicum]PAS93392.1 MAG: cytochrome c4 [Candidatus Dactylopiibacterium carminicum]PAS98309.1 MAG: cytochrome c4 [Candidatus Dactylopiibacterium carminicum]PAS99352.1 MAG: cytochrome c4 [Candidatus Dactylopiibacterium carminicum]